MIFLINSVPEQVMSRVTGRSERVWRPLGRPRAPVGGALRCLRSCHRLRLQPPQPDQVVSRPRKSEQPTDFLRPRNFTLRSIPIIFIQPKLCSTRFRFC